MTVKGYVSKIVYRSEETGYTVMTLDTDNDEVCCVGVMAVFDEGEYVEAEGESVFHPQYGDQIRVSRVEVIEPTDAKEMERYLGSGAIVGVGPALAKRIVKMFGDDTFRIMDEEPEKLAQVKGISEAGAMRITDQFLKKRELRKAMIFLQRFGISNSLAVKIYSFYGEKMYSVIRVNPYRLAEDISGVGFKSADEIAMRSGLAPDDDFRVRAALFYTLSLSTGSGHVYLPEEELFKKTVEMVPCEEEQLKQQLTRLFTDHKIVIKEEETRNVYLSSFYYMELSVARMLCDLNCKFEIPEAKIRDRIEGVTKDLDIELDDLQSKAIFEAVQHGVFILTGGPGTGKTTTINAIIRFFEREGMDVMLAAPTGRAAKRMSETTGKEAKTIHRLLELQKKPDDSVTTGIFDFARNESNPLETDVMIVDEVSMVDISLMNALLRAISVGTRMIFVGDVNQLPSVGPGNVLKDMIASERFSTVKLEKIFRQAAESSIIVNAHKINKGEDISLDNRENSDFFFLERRDVNQITEGIIYLVQSKISNFVGVTPFDVQVLTPMKAGELGCEKLNLTLQNTLNPGERGKAEKVFENGKVFREGDKVMQIKNDYQLEWVIKSKRGITVDSGTGVFNGDCGLIREINLVEEKITVEFEEGRQVDYTFSQHDELVLAYAITIHKSQGSEYPAVVMPLLTGPSMLFNRNVLYTAVTRAKKCVTIIGSSDTIQRMIRNTMEQRRYSGLERAIRDVG
jgi:exodeoxyribonuclease V alpha subunit